MEQLLIFFIEISLSVILATATIMLHTDKDYKRIITLIRDVEYEDDNKHFGGRL